MKRATISKRQRRKPKHNKKSLTIPTKGWEASINVMVGRAIMNMKLMGCYSRDDVDALRERVKKAPDYNSQVDILHELFPIEGRR